MWHSLYTLHLHTATCITSTLSRLKYLAVSVNDALCTLLVVAHQQVHNDSAAVLDLFVAAGQKELKDLNPVQHLCGKERRDTEHSRHTEDSNKKGCIKTLSNHQVPTEAIRPAHLRQTPS
ncbi:hypothetical protein E2C01_043392 [Portunus trituberculatus]|uniref:Uncharacterized protein n=1 Tax=Portunus trituberculatus TaxID=210409 RepID=A0A5B7FW92_PORTR|nr:hypothetical protein [Portunus trituberculatus]